MSVDYPPPSPSIQTLQVGMCHLSEMTLKSKIFFFLGAQCHKALERGAFLAVESPSTDIRLFISFNLRQRNYGLNLFAESNNGFFVLFIWESG